MSAYPGNSSSSPKQAAYQLPVRVLLHRLLVAAALVALFLPSAGPVLDHHFAERQPHHTHIYLAGDAAHHSHFYERGHSHAHVHPHPGHIHAPPQDSGIIYLTSSDGLGQSANSLATTTHQVEVVFLSLGGDPWLPRFSSQDLYPPESFVLPPEKPPRA